MKAAQPGGGLRQGALSASTALISSPSVPSLASFAGDGGFLLAKEGAGLAGRGVALRISLPKGLADPDAPAVVSATLSAISTDDQVGLPGCGPVAIAALPFDPLAPAELVVPEVLLGRASDGTTWLTTVGPDCEIPRSATMLSEADPSEAVQEWAPDSFELISVVPHPAWCETVAKAVASIEQGSLEKVVLARQVKVVANRPILASSVLGRLSQLYPSCGIFSVDGFVGASPELLLRKTSSAVVSQPLAGTVARSGDGASDSRSERELLASPKDRREHALVVESVRELLSPFCEDLSLPETPSLVRLRNVSHLGTLVEGRLRSPAPSSLALAAALHPTPAVAGAPRDSALEFIRAHEDMDRGRYAGPVGWVDANGDGEWWVGIRSATLEGSTATLSAGVGVVRGSEPREELAETQLKLQALLAAVVRP